jgi:hypothetical protein
VRGTEPTSDELQRGADDAHRARLKSLLGTCRASAAIGDKLDSLTPAVEARIVKRTLPRKPPDGSTQWSTRKLGRSSRSAT